MKRVLRNKKGLELSINMLVIIALAVFALLVIVGFVFGGFSWFAGLFKGVTSQPHELAKVNCERDLYWANTRYSGKIPTNTDAYAKLCGYRYDIDFDNDGAYGVDTQTQEPIDSADGYKCSDYIDTTNICSSSPLLPRGT